MNNESQCEIAASNNQSQLHFHPTRFSTFGQYAGFAHLGNNSPIDQRTSKRQLINLHRRGFIANFKWDGKLEVY